ncbi:molecular chaperone GrpE [Psychroflexus salarius]|uniref:Protein GrpE n=1 Tax=Psychroflexus salarius TaxID=1155689 RepID=A0A1M4X0J8_9FLAO|nr:nucleotide exchange factor GrpE [Psychroflexus salarius]SHE87036.1 molecular chaperone GrpE [Psychroflexus salarius]
MKKEQDIIKDTDKNEKVQESSKASNTSNDETSKEQSEENHEGTALDEQDISEEKSTNKDKEEKEELSETEKLQLALDTEKDKHLRLFAEFENYKRRTSKERLELFKTAGQEVIQSLLPVLDDFDRAIKELEKSTDKDSFSGVELINNKLRETLKSKGLEPMNVKAGDVFDADLHEAITQISAPSEDMKGKIIDVVERGYTLGDKIIRYPKVVTGK